MTIATHAEMMLDRAIVFAACVALVGCTALQPVPQDPGASRVAVGDLVRVGYAGGSHVELKVRALTAGGFVGDASRGTSRSAPVEVRYADVVSLETHEYSGGRTLKLVLAIVAIAAVLVALLGGLAPPPG